MSYTPPIYQIPNEIIISTCSPESLGAEISALTLTTAAATHVTQQGIYVPVWIPTSMLVLKMFHFNGGVVTGNLDMGIYGLTSGGQPGSRLVSTGNIAQSGASVLQEFDIADTTLRGPGWFYMAVSSSGAGEMTRWSIPAGVGRAIGVMYEAPTTGNPLPATATPAAMAITNVPFIGMSGRTLVL